jgi:rhamnosyltransferase
VSTGAHGQVAGVVVLYNPAAGVLDNINSYLSQIGRLFAVDNSETPDPDVMQQLAAMPGVTYHANGGNLGVASALNIGAKLALAYGYSYLLTMDQDSQAAPDMVKNMLACLAGQEATTGIVAPFLVRKSNDEHLSRTSCERVLTAMTSGSLLNLTAYRSVGPFRDDYFIDFIDNEYGLRLNMHDFSVIRTFSARLKHNVGSPLKVSLAGVSFALTSHPPLRKYYKTRNRLYLAQSYFHKFPGYCIKDFLRFWGELVRLFLFEEQKWNKLNMMIKGIADFRKGRSGRYEDFHEGNR